MFDNEIDLGIEADGEAIYDALRNSEYMEERGYETLYEEEYTESDQIDEDDISIDMQGQGDALAYGVCYTIDEDDAIRFIHFRNQAGEDESTLTYSFTMGNDEQGRDDLKALAKEIRDTLEG